jgi:hypothetical protein
VGVRVYKKWEHEVLAISGASSLRDQVRCVARSKPDSVLFLLSAEK